MLTSSYQVLKLPEQQGFFQQTKAEGEGIFPFEEFLKIFFFIIKQNIWKKLKAFSQTYKITPSQF